MPYQKDLDKEVFKDSREFGNTKLTIGVYSYNNSDAKLQIAREFKNTEGQWQISKLGRLTKEEVESILPLINKAREQM